MVIDPGTSSEEKCSATISGSTLTLTRAQDDTTAVSHSSGATIYPVFSADDADEANALASTLTTRGDIIRMASGPTVGRLALGASGTVLYSDGTDPAWASLSTAGIAAVASPTFTGTPAAPTAANGTNTTQLATTAYVYANGSQATVSTKTASYVLVAADRNIRVVMNSPTTTTITVNTSLFSAGDSLEIANIGAGICTVTAGTATVTTASSLAVAQYQGGTLFFTSASAAIFFPTDSAPTTAATISIFNETQAANTAGGASVQTTYTKRTLNTSVINNTGATLTTSVIALLAGTYKVSASAPFFNPGAVAIRLQNTTDSSTTVAGQNAYASPSSSVGATALLNGTFTITGTKNFEVQYYQTGAAVGTNGLGVQINSAGVSEIYTTITIEKTA